MTELTKIEVSTLLDIADRNSCDVDGDTLTFVVKRNSNVAAVVERCIDGPTQLQPLKNCNDTVNNISKNYGGWLRILVITCGVLCIVACFMAITVKLISLIF